MFDREGKKPAIIARFLSNKFMNYKESEFLYKLAHRQCPSIGAIHKRAEHIFRSACALQGPARAAAITGSYIGIVGVALLAAPATCFGMLFDARYFQNI